jgi:tRNA G18 (ribose-2'-O)-methylase SpoU
MQRPAEHNRPPVITAVESLDDERLAPYRNLPDGELARLGRRFIAEGELVVRRLLASELAVESVLLADRQVAKLAAALRPEVPVYAAPAEVVDRIVGFGFHSGVMACGLRPPDAGLDQARARLQSAHTVVVLPEITKTDNLGAILRTCSAFGAPAVLGPRSCDPYYRQSVRVSMGAVFEMCLARSADLRIDLPRLQDWGFELVAAVLDPSAEPLPMARRNGRTAILLGNEFDGLRETELSLCRRRVTVPMGAGVDSLNVSAAAAVMLYHFTHVAHR